MIRSDSPRILLRSALAAVVVAAAMVAAPRACAGAEVRLDVPYRRQPDGSTCMPTSLLMALDYFGKDRLGTDRIHELHRRTRVNRLNIPAIVREYGLECDASYSPYWTIDDIRADLDDGLPVILGTDLSDAGHIMVAVGYTDDGRILVHDPGYRREGFAPVTLEEIRFDGGGVRFREAPYGEWQAEWVAQADPGRLRSGERGRVTITWRNRGTNAWPPGKVTLRPTDTPSPWDDPETWESPGIAARVKRAVAPGDEISVEFTLLGPIAGGPRGRTEIPFHLARPDGEPFHYPRDRDVNVDLRFAPAFPLPMEDACAPDTPRLPWTARFTEPESVRRRGRWALKVQDPEAGGYDSIRTGDRDVGDYTARALLWCEPRPRSDDGFERIGLFVRDDDGGDFDSNGKGNCYAMLFETGDGMIRCVRIRDGTIHELHREPVRVESAGWREFTIGCDGPALRFALDGEPVVAVHDGFRTTGPAGIGHHEYLPDHARAQGALVARFRLEPPPARRAAGNR